jgi:hypothetical protein
LNDRSYHPPSNDDAIAWTTRLRNKNLSPSAAESNLLKAPPPEVNGYYPALALVGGQPAGAVLEKLFESDDPNIRRAAAETCRHGIFGASTTAALAKLATDPSVQVRQAAIGVLAMYANWRYQPAQAALIELATDTSDGASDRINAADALAYAVRYQVNGARLDPPMFQALVSLLEDEEEPVRATAVAALAPAYEPALPDEPRRRSPEGGWEQWLAAIASNEPAGQQARGDLASTFQSALKAAGKGDVKAQTGVAMMYANGKGVEQNYAEAGKWWLKAASGGDLVAARHAWNLYRNGEGVARDRDLANQMAVLIGEPIQAPRPDRNTSNRPPATGGATARD